MSGRAVTNLHLGWTHLPVRMRGFLTWLGVFAGLVLLKRNALLLPASWDESWAVLPGGFWLSDNNFDLVGLLSQPQWFDYGPGTYALSPITWLTGIIASVTDSPKQFITVAHLVHMAIGAIGLREVYRFARPVWSQTASAGLVVVTAMVPVMNAQLGFMYLEIPIFTVGMLSVNAALNGQWNRAALWGALATSFKASGILPLGAAVAATYFVQPTLKSARRSLLVMAPSVIVGVLPVIVSDHAGGFDRDLQLVLSSSATQILRMPELAIALTVAIVFLTLPGRDRTTDQEQLNSRVATFTWLGILFVGFYVFTALFVIRLFVLPRYFIILVPFTLFVAWEVSVRRFGRTTSGVLAGALLALMIVNSSGALMPGRASATSVGLESSNAYAERLLLTHATLSGALETDNPVFLSSNLWFKSQYPGLGYVDAVPPNVRKLIDLDPNNLPETFVIVETESDQLATEYFFLLDELQLDREITEFHRDGFTSRYVTFSQPSG